MKLQTLFKSFVFAAIALVACLAASAGASDVGTTLVGIDPSLMAGLAFGGTVFSEPLRIGDILKREYDKLFNRETVTIDTGTLVAGTVVGKITKSTAAPTAQAAAGNTGDGTIGTITPSAGVKLGVYRLTIIEPGADAGKFSVEDPDGINVGNGTVGVAFSGGGLAFTLSDGAADFVSGDSFNITVAAGTGKYVAYNASGTDGSEVAAGILLEAADASGGDVKAAILARGPAVVERSALTGLDAAGEVDLLALNIVIRTGVGAGPVSIV